MLRAGFEPATRGLEGRADASDARRRRATNPHSRHDLGAFDRTLRFPERGPAGAFEWAVLERCDVDRGRGVLSVRRTVSAGEVSELGKTSRSRREVPLSARALAALDGLPPRLDTPYPFAAKRGGPFDLNNFRRREWAPTIEASGVRRPACLYDLRSTFASNALAAGVSVFELGRLMGTSVAMIERHCGTLLEGAGADIARRLSAFEAEQEPSDARCYP
jgi:hypothetical protein